jgi:hypothetical protein
VGKYVESSRVPLSPLLPRALPPGWPGPELADGTFNGLGLTRPPGAVPAGRAGTPPAGPAGPDRRSKGDDGGV